MYIFFLILSLFTHTIVASQPQEHVNFFITSLPKSGTNLVGQLLFYLTGKSWVMPRFFTIEESDLNIFAQNKFLAYHMPASAKNIDFVNKSKLRGIAIMRDPRDVIVSSAYYMPSNLPIHDRITELIRNYKLFFDSCLVNYSGPATIDEIYQGYKRWELCPLAYITRYEDLVGAAGGGSNAAQLIEIRRIVRHLGINATGVQIKTVITQLWGKSPTFRNGKIGAWKTEFTQEQKKLFHTLYANFIASLGYESTL